MRNNDFDSIDLFVFIGYIILLVIILAIGGGVANCIGESDLPYWVKFWLLS